MCKEGVKGHFWGVVKSAKTANTNYNDNTKQLSKRRKLNMKSVSHVCV